MRYATVLFAVLLAAQPVRTNTLKVSAGTLFCTFTTFTPPALTGINADCTYPGGTLKQNTALAPAPAPGQTGKLISGPDSIEWRFQLAGAAVMYQVTSNGKKETGSL